jgi:hypothetical protein
MSPSLARSRVLIRQTRRSTTEGKEEIFLIGEETESGRSGFDFDALRVAIEGKDADLLLGFYSEDSELRILNAALLEGVAFELKGRSQIERYLRAVCDQEMSCTIAGEPIFGEESVSFFEVCGYPDGARISVETTLEIAGGKIRRQLDVARSARRDDRSEI